MLRSCRCQRGKKIPVGRTGPVLQYTCTGGELMALGGGILVPIASGRMLTPSTLKDAATGGKRKPTTERRRRRGGTYTLPRGRP